MTSDNKINIIGVPTDFGANTRGTNMGPAALRIAGLKARLEHLDFEVTDLGDIKIPTRESLSSHQKEKHFLPVVTELCLALKNKVKESLSSLAVPLIIGGDHSLSIGSIAATNEYIKDAELGVLWIDTHADFNSEHSSPTKNIHGMPLSVVLGNGYSELTDLMNNKFINPKNTVIIGLRSIDGKEKELLRKSGITYFTMRDIDELGVNEVMKKSLDIITKHTVGIHVSLDLDVIDPIYVPGVSTPVSGGLSLRETHLILELLAESKKILSIDVVELNPYTDQAAQSATVAVELIQSAFGKSIV
jgi:arginase